MNKALVRARIEEVGIMAAVRVSASEQALYAAEAVSRAGIPIAEITLTVPNALGVIAHLAKNHPALVVGAGTVLDAEQAQQCVDAGATFLTSPGLVMEVVEFAVKNEVTSLPGATTATEAITAWKAGADFVKIYPCSHLGGPSYIRALKVPLPQIPLMASGGVTLQNGADYVHAGAVVLGVGSDLIPVSALKARREEQIAELSRRFLAMMNAARAARQKA
jgi:2-dehydro-3-deoxyphosphogluconate aldolase/(4S)-4-hydroxy-2-oxoglutarate aldolase